MRKDGRRSPTSNKMTDKIFSRQQALKISGLSSGQLSRLDKSGIVQPKKLGSSSHPTVLYSYNQVLELKAIAVMRDKLSTSELIQLLASLRSHKFDSALFCKFLIFCGNELHWVQEDEIGRKVAALMDSNGGQASLKVVHSIGDISFKF